jgi:hypothetical protein
MRDAGVAVVTKGLVSFDAPCRLNSFPIQCAVGCGGDRGRLDRHRVAAQCVARPGGNNVERLSEAVVTSRNPLLYMQRNSRFIMPALGCAS